MNSTPSARGPRVVDLDSLKALAHPLRVQIFDALSLYGPATASGLGERLGESSGATSYHLRQLEKHAFVREVVGKGTGRERWWERTPGGVSVEPSEFTDSPAAREASRTVVREFGANRERLLREFQARGADELPDEWLRASISTTSNFRLTAEQLADFRNRFMVMVEEFHDKFRGQSVPGSRPVEVQFNAFPIMDGEVTPGNDQKQ